MKKALANFFNLINVIKNLEFLSDSTSVKIKHKHSESYIEFANDGNVNVYAARNLAQDAAGLILQSSPELNQFASTEEVKAAHPEWFDTGEIINHGCSHTEPATTSEQYCFGSAWGYKEPGFKIFFREDSDPKRGYPYNKLGDASYISLM